MKGSERIGDKNGVIAVKKEQFTARKLNWTNKKVVEKIYAFREIIFCDELGWETKYSNENDHYDNTSVHFAVFSDKRGIVAYSRLHLAKGGFMLENEFKDLVSNKYRIRKKDDTVEGSRFAVAPYLRRTKEGFLVTELLCQRMCIWSKKNGIKYMYAVLDRNYLDFLKRFFSIRSIGPMKEYEQGLKSIAVIVDLRGFGKKESTMFWDSLGIITK